MTKRHIVHLMCDICGRNGAETWQVGNPEGERAKVDLCPRCDNPIRKAFVAGRKSQRLEPQGLEAMEQGYIDDYEPTVQTSQVQAPTDHWAEARERQQKKNA